MASHKWNIKSIITNKFKQDEIVNTLETARDSKKALNVMIKYE